MRSYLTLFPQCGKTLNLITKKQKSYVNVDGLNRINVDIWGGGGTVPLTKLVPVLLLAGSETGRNGYGLGRGHGRVADRPAK